MGHCCAQTLVPMSLRPQNRATTTGHLTTPNQCIPIVQQPPQTTASPRRSHHPQNTTSSWHSQHPKSSCPYRHGHRVPMTRPPLSAIMSLLTWTPPHFMAQPPPQATGSPWHGYYPKTGTAPNHPVPMAQPAAQATTSPWHGHHPKLPHPYRHGHEPKSAHLQGTATTSYNHVPTSTATTPSNHILWHSHHPKVPRSHGAGTRSITPITPHVQHHVSGDNIPSGPQRDPTVIPVPIPCSWATTAPQPSKQSPLAAEGWGRTKLRGSISSCRTPAALCKG